MTSDQFFAPDSERVKSKPDIAIELAELQATFDLRWRADRRAMELWRKQTGRSLVAPDHADLVVFLLDRIERATAALQAAPDVLRKGKPTVQELAAVVKANVCAWAILTEGRFPPAVTGSDREILKP